MKTEEEIREKYNHFDALAWESCYFTDYARGYFDALKWVLNEYVCTTKLGDKCTNWALSEVKE